MNYFKRISAAVAVAAMLAATSSLVAQDDLDDLLADLEGETAGVAAAPAEEAPAAAEEELTVEDYCATHRLTVCQTGDATPWTWDSANLCYSGGGYKLTLNSTETTTKMVLTLA